MTALRLLANRAHAWLLVAGKDARFVEGEEHERLFNGSPREAPD